MNLSKLPHAHQGRYNSCPLPSLAYDAGTWSWTRRGQSSYTGRGSPNSDVLACQGSNNGLVDTLRSDHTPQRVELCDLSDARIGDVLQCGRMAVVPKSN